MDDFLKAIRTPEFEKQEQIKDNDPLAVFVQKKQKKKKIKQIKVEPKQEVKEEKIFVEIKSGYSALIDLGDGFYTYKISSQRSKIDHYLEVKKNAKLLHIRPVENTFLARCVTERKRKKYKVRGKGYTLPKEMVALLCSYTK